jgi:isopentenyl phosphate kinase
MRPVTFIKWGGSLITDKTGRFSVRTDVLERLADELACYHASAPNAPIVLGHGSGSFGHVAAREAGFDPNAALTDPAPALSQIQKAVAKLHRHVVHVLRNAGLPVFSWAPSSAFVTTRGTPQLDTAAPVQHALSAGALPVTYGDITLDTEHGLSICSTETVFRTLIDALRQQGRPVARVLWCGNTDGVYDADGHTLPHLTAEQARAMIGDVHAPGGTDVTGGMALRLRTASALAEQGIDSLLLNGTVPGRFAATLRSAPDAHCTRIAAG